MGRGATVTSVFVPLKIVSVANLREHWGQKAARAKLHRSHTALALRASTALCVPLPGVVRLVRIAPRKLDDDNLSSALKACRDGVADWLGINDNDPRVRWEYGQERGKPGEHGLRIELA